MDYYFQAAHDEAALRARELPSGPTANSVFYSVEAKDVIACPHLEQLVKISLGKSCPSLVPKLVTLWPKPPSRGASTDVGPEPSLFRLPDELRDHLAMVTADGDVGERWAAELWGYQPDRARSVAQSLAYLAQSARDGGQSLYWWSEI